MTRVFLKILVVFMLCQGVSVAATGSNSGKPGKSGAVKPGKAGPGTKTVTSGFSFVVEPVPAWVVPLPAVDKPVVSGSVAVQVPLLDFQLQIEGKQATEFVHVQRHLSGAAGLGNAGQIQIQFDPQYQELVLHQLDVLRGGQRLNKLDIKRVQLLQRESQLEARIYDGRVTASLVLDDVRVGDSIEYAYSIRGSNPVFEGKFSFIDYVGSERGPVGLYQLRLLAPEGRTIHSRIPEGVVVEKRSLNGKTETLFRQRDVPHRAGEVGAPASVWLPHMIQLSEFADWNEVAAWGARQFANSTASGVGLTRQIDTWRALPAPQQVQQALDFVQKEVRYFGTEMGVNSHRPNTPQKVLEQRFGDCKDKTLLLITILRALGHTAEPVLVSVRHRAEASTMLPSPLAFDHVIAKVMHEGKPYWLDSTRSQQTGPFEQRQSSAFDKGLPLGGNGSWATLPDWRDQVLQHVVDRFEVHNFAQEPVLISTITWSGPLAEAMREYLARTPQEEVKNRFTRPYLRPYPHLSIKTPLRVVELQGQNALSVVQEFSLKEFWIATGLQYMSAGFFYWSFDEHFQVPDGVARRTPFQIPLAGIFRHTIETDFTDDVFASSNERKVSDSHASFSWKLTNSGTKRSSSVVAELRYLADTITPAQWRSYVDKTRQLRSQLVAAMKIGILKPEEVEEVERLMRNKTAGQHGQYGKEGKAQLAVALTADAVLKSKRLTPELRRTALAMRIESGLALGYYEQSAEDFNTWLDLNPTPDTKQLVLGTMVAFFNSQDDLALTYVGRALDLAPQDPKLAWLKLSLAYAKGDYQAAQATFKQHLESNPDGEEEVNQQLHSVMQYLLTRRNGGDVTALLAKQEQRTDLEAKDRKVIEFMKGALSWQQLEKELKEGKSRIRGNLAALHFLQAEKAWLDGNVQVAREHWTEVLRLGKPERLESIMAKRHLAQLDKSS